MDLENCFLINKICRVGSDFKFFENLEEFLKFFNGNLFKIVMNLVFCKDKVGIEKDLKLSKFEICLNKLLMKVLVLNVF